MHFFCDGGSDVLMIIPKLSLEMELLRLLNDSSWILEEGDPYNNSHYCLNTLPEKELP